MKVVTKILGFRHRGVASDILKSSSVPRLKLQPEPSNAHDPNAVKFILNDQHIAYIEKEKSLRVSSLLTMSQSYKITVEEVCESYAKISIDFSTSEQQKISSAPLGLTDKAGVYEARFQYNGSDWHYYGQSTNIGKRVDQHLRSLRGGSHANTILQKAWVANPGSFQFYVRELLNDRENPLFRQINLFQREIHFIKMCHGNCANILDGDLVLTADAKHELDELKNEIRIRILSSVENQNRIKEAIGEIMILERMVYGYGTDLTKGNVLSQIKKRWSPLSNNVFVDRLNPLFGYLYKALQEAQNRILKMSEDKKFVQQFPRRSSSATKYATVKIDEVDLFLTIIKRYQSELPLISKVGKHKIGAKINYDSVLDQVLPKEALAFLINGVPKSEKQQTNNSGAGSDKSNTRNLIGRLFGR